MNITEASTVIKLLLYGSPETLGQLADSMNEEQSGETLFMLVSTLHSNEEWRLRAKCLEVLGRAAARAPEHTARAILKVVSDGGTEKDRTLNGEASFSTRHV